MRDISSRRRSSRLDGGLITHAELKHHIVSRQLLPGRAFRDPDSSRSRPPGSLRGCARSHCGGSRRPQILPHISTAGRTGAQGLFDLPYIRRLRADRPDLAHFEPAVLIASVSDGWIKLTVRAWINKIPRKDEIASRYLKEVLRRLQAEDIPVKAEVS